jgi:dienelactone hydrolase
MHIKNITAGFLLAGSFLITSCNDTKSDKGDTSDSTLNANMKALTPVIKEEAVRYAVDTVNMNGFVAYDEATEKKRPIVMIVHEWWGLNDYTKTRARQLAALGYLAFAVDMYGNGATADNPDQAGKMSGPFYQDPQMAKKRFDAALAKAKSYAVADSSQVAAIGYCFGGAQVINMAKLGDQLSGVVSFHGNLNVVPADKNLLKSPILVCHGDDDKFVSPAEVALFKKQMDSIGATYTFKSYAGATHAFTNPQATMMGEKFKIPIAYNAAADTASWNDMKDFFGKIFK